MFLPFAAQEQELWFRKKTTQEQQQKNPTPLLPPSPNFPLNLDMV